MAIDWITVSAQIINFLILVWLLKRFLYQPVMLAMERREQRIAERLIEAEQREQQAHAAIHQYQAKAGELEHGREEILRQARQEAEQQKMHMLDAARAEVDATRANWQHQASDEKAEFLGSLRRQAADAFQVLARKALSDLADADLEERIVQTFIARLKSLDKETRLALVQTSEPVRIRSAFELDSVVRGRLTRALHEQLADGIEVNYEASPELLCGIELSSAGRRLSWNAADYLEELTTRIETAFTPLETAGKEA